MKYYIIAGEASGDLHGSNLMKQIQQKDSEAVFRFWGGEAMAGVGGTQVEHYKNTAFMGFWEVLKNIHHIVRFIRQCKKDILQWNPDVVILIDYPGFNLRMAKFAKQHGYKVVYYISPQLWAWKESRITKIRQYVDKMLVILPFEEAFYAKHHIPVSFVGHPLLDAIDKKEYTHVLPEQPTIALLPGSRQQEIKRILPYMLSVVDHFPHYHFIIGGLSHIGMSFYKNIIQHREISIEMDNTYSLLSKSFAAIVTSGTATLETALFNVPMVVVYKGSWLSYQIGKRLVNLDSISLVNIIMEEKVVSELIQDDLNEKNIKSALEELFIDSNRKAIQSKYGILEKKLGESGASERAARIIYEFAHPSNT